MYVHYVLDYFSATLIYIFIILLINGGATIANYSFKSNISCTKRIVWHIFQVQCLEDMILVEIMFKTFVT